jgi:hypothetical protein
MTEESLKKLKTEGMPEDILNKLELQKEKQFVGEGKFFTALRTIIGEDQTNKFGSLILTRTILKELNGSDRNATVYVEYFDRVVSVIYNQINITVKELTDVILESGFETSQSIHTSRIGKNIVIPPNFIG